MEKEPILFFEPALIHCNPKRIKTLRSSLLGVRDHPPEFHLYPLERFLRAEIYPMRPTKESSDRVVAFYLEGTKEKLDLSEGEKGYFISKNDQLVFSNKPTKFGFSFTIVDSETVLVNMEYDLKEFKSYDIKLVGNQSFVLKSSIFPYHNRLELKLYQELLSGEWLGKDLILSKFVKEKAPGRLRIVDSILSVNPEEAFFYQSKQWKSCFPFSAKFSPVFQVKEMNQDHLVLFFWESGNAKEHRIYYSQANLNSSFVESRDLLKAHRLRRNSQVLCSIEKKRLVVKKSDWIVKQNNKWEVINDYQILELLKNSPFFEAIYIRSIIDNTEKKEIEIEYFNLEHNHSIIRKVSVVEPSNSDLVETSRRIKNNGIDRANFSL